MKGYNQGKKHYTTMNFLAVIELIDITKGSILLGPNRND